MRDAVACAREVPALFESLCAGDDDALRATRAHILELEGRAHRTRARLETNLPAVAPAPVDRRALLSVLTAQGSIADTAQDIAGLLEERRFEVPAGLGGPLVALCHRCVDVCEQALGLVGELDRLFVDGVREHLSDRVEVMLKALARAERETDDLGLELARRLIGAEREMRPVSVMLWYRLVEWVGDLADYAEKATIRLRLAVG